ncbi:MAG: XRE family transcriptional regulator [Candidatus Magasanikbacteria bacterium]|nr:XRE family transcriptional regulator [Candidatus Magasanikbacteria bacterium]
MNGTLKDEMERSAFLNTMRSLIEQYPAGQAVYVHLAFSANARPNESEVFGRTMEVAPSRSAPKVRTQLSRFLREVRGKMTQTSFMGKLGLDDRPQYLSKVETGRIGVPDLSFLTALAKFSGRTAEDLREMSRQNI